MITDSAVPTNSPAPSAPMTASFPSDICIHIWTLKHIPHLTVIKYGSSLNGHACIKKCRSIVHANKVGKKYEAETVRLT